LLIAIPRHRVVGQSGKPTGDAGGLQCKAWLLDHERMRV
jgi:O6-methylguanine-DNA--protein-cysteine methyltransferase